MEYAKQTNAHNRERHCVSTGGSTMSVTIWGDKAEKSTKSVPQTRRGSALSAAAREISEGGKRRCIVDAPHAWCTNPSQREASPCVPAMPHVMEVVRNQ